jgi:hypothetical protein
MSLDRGPTSPENPPPSVTTPPGQHTEQEDVPWKILIPDHPQRTDSPAFVAARSLAHQIMDTLKGYPYGPGPWQMHHGGSLWTYDDGGWFLVLNTLGCEWSAQFCSNPAKIELMRLNASRHYAGFPKSIPQMTSMGYSAAQDILTTPITTAELVARYVDSVFNSCVPLAAPWHVGEVTVAAPYGGVHHYPKSIADIQFFKYDDFILWVTDPQSGQLVAVTPASPRGSGDGRVEVAFAAPGTELHAAQTAARAAGERLLLPADHPIARAAFALQSGPVTPESETPPGATT